MPTAIQNWEDLRKERETGYHKIGDAVSQTYDCRDSAGHVLVYTSANLAAATRVTFATVASWSIYKQDQALFLYTTNHHLQTGKA